MKKWDATVLETVFLIQQGYLVSLLLGWIGQVVLATEISLMAHHIFSHSAINGWIQDKKRGWLLGL